MRTIFSYLSIAFFSLFMPKIMAQKVPDIISNKKVMAENYLPDFSYAGYHYGEKAIPNSTENIVLATDYGVIANDELDDSKALIKAITEASKKEGNVILQLPSGKIILSDHQE